MLPDAVLGKTKSSSETQEKHYNITV